MTFNLSERNEEVVNIRQRRYIPPYPYALFVYPIHSFNRLNPVFYMRSRRRLLSQDSFQYNKTFLSHLRFFFASSVSHSYGCNPTIYKWHFYCGFKFWIKFQTHTNCLYGVCILWKFVLFCEVLMKEKQ